MSISRPNVRDALPLLVACLSCAAGAAPASASTGAPAKLTPVEVAKARQVALPALKVSVEEPADRVPTLKIAATPVWSDAGASHKALLLASFTYPGAQYTYCRLVTVSADLTSAQVADASEMPDCLGIAHGSFIDLNGDGLVDVVVGLRVQSNSADVTLEVPAVFLSDASVPGGYCYSQQASDHLQPDDLASAARAKASLERERSRLGLARFVCGRY